jgi:hypothetical protein
MSTHVCVCVRVDVHKRYAITVCTFIVFVYASARVYRVRPKRTDRVRNVIINNKPRVYDGNNCSELI